MALSDAQRRALALLPKPSGIISGICSALIIYSVLRSARKRASVYHRLLLGISLVDVCNSFWFFLSTWPIPDSATTMYAVGTPATCELQGFWIQFGNAAGMYNASLALYYLLVLRYGWKEGHIQRTMEPWLHGIPIVWGAATATLGIPLRLYNNANLWCWIASYPAGCVGDDCIRAPDANRYRWMFYYGPLWLCIVFVTVAMGMVYQRVHAQISSSTVSATSGPDEEDGSSSSDGLDEMLMEENDIHHNVGSNNNNINNNRGHTRCSHKQLRRNIALQCFLYAASFYFNWTWLTTVRILQAADRDVPYQLIAVAATVTPLLGLPNFCVYLFPTFLAAKQAHPEAGMWAWIRASL